MERGLYKYIVKRADGTPTAPDAQYFVLRIDTDIHARTALRAYARSIIGENPELSRDLERWLLDTRDAEGGQ